MSEIKVGKEIGNFVRNYYKVIRPGLERDRFSLIIEPVARACYKGEIILEIPREQFRGNSYLFYKMAVAYLKGLINVARKHHSIKPSGILPNLDDVIAKLEKNMSDDEDYETARDR